MIMFIRRMLAALGYPWRLAASQRAATENPIAAAGILLEALGIPVTDTTLRRLLVTHPQYPSLQALADALEDVGVASRAVQANSENLVELSLPAIAGLGRGPEMRFVVLREVRPGQGRYTDPGRGEVVLPEREFSLQWSGILLLPTVSPDAGERDYRKRRTEEVLERLRGPALAVGAALTVILLLTTLPPMEYEPSVLWHALLLVKLSGFGLATLLIAMSGSQDGGAAKLCPLGERLNCRSVLSSPAAKLGGWIPMADLGGLYFLGGLLSLVLWRIAERPESLPAPLGLLNLLALPYVVFSVSYQAFLGRWCWPCLGVQALFVAEFALFWQLPGSHSLPIDGLPRVDLALLVVSFALPALGWGALRPRWAQGCQADARAEENARLRSHPALFQQALQRSTPIPTDPIPHELAMGPDAAPFCLTVLVHPACDHCAEVFSELQPLLALSKGLLRCVVRLCFVPGGRTEAIARRIAELTVAGKPGSANEALVAWFADQQQSVPAWIERYVPEPTPAPEAVAETLRATLKWIEAAAIAGAPALFLNGRRIATSQIRDLRIFLRAHVRQHQTAQQSLG